MNPTESMSPSLGELLQELRSELTTLLRQEAALAKREMSEKARRMSQHAIQLALGGLVAYAGVIVLLFGLGDLVSVTMINAGVSPAVSMWLAPALLGLAVIATGYAILAQARRALAADSLVPERTLQSLRQEKDLISPNFQASHE